MRALAVLALLIVGCSNGDDTGADESTLHADAATAPPPSDARAEPETSAPVPWVPFMTGDWSLDPGVEAYTCVRLTLDEETWIGGFRPIDPPGSHHAALFLDEIALDGTPISEPDGVAVCNGTTQGAIALFAAGVGTTELVFPTGVATKVPAGRQLILSLHLLNPTEETMTGTSGIEVQLVPAAEVAEEAEVVFAGAFNLVVPPGESTQTGTCTLPHDTTIVGVIPHMHVLGTYMTTRAEPAAGPATTLIDEPYSFTEQTVRTLDPPLPLRAGDQLRVDCTYMNDTGAEVRFGPSSYDEMCFALTYWYPPRPEDLEGPASRSWFLGGRAGSYCADE